MELIEALEQLSLRVKSDRICKFNNCRSLSSYDQTDGSTSHQQNLSKQVAQDKSWRYTSLDIEPSQRDQLDEFDKSIETLFAQINELDCLKSNVIKHGAENMLLPVDSDYEAASKTFKSPSSRLSLPPRSSFTLSGSLETSQEDDSDYSSQQSGCLTQDHNNVNPFVRDLLRRDLGTITDTMRKIGNILSIGDDIESIYKRSLCSTFIALCSNEPYICDLPTIIRYNEFCQKLSANLDLLEQNCSKTATANFVLSTDTSTNSMTSLIEPGIDSGESGAGISSSDNDELMCLDQASDALDCALLECEQKSLNNHWTENKLYINQPAQPQSTKFNQYEHFRFQ